MFWQKKTKSFFDYFEEIALFIHQSAEILNLLFSARSNHNGNANKIRDFEHQADLLAHQAINQMNSSSFVLPLDHEDILFFLNRLDDVMDYIDDAAEVYTQVYQLKETTSHASRLTEGVLRGTLLLQKNCELVRNPSKYSADILQNCRAIKLIENEADDIRTEALKELYQKLKENNIDIASYIAWNEIYQTLERISDKLEDCGDMCEQFVMKYS